MLQNATATDFTVFESLTENPQGNGGGGGEFGVGKLVPHSHSTQFQHCRKYSEIIQYINEYEGRTNKFAILACLHWPVFPPKFENFPLFPKF